MPRALWDRRHFVDPCRSSTGCPSRYRNRCWWAETEADDRDATCRSSRWRSPALQRLGECDLFRRDATSGFGKQHAAFVAAHAVANGESARHEGRPTGSAHAGRRVELREPHTLRRHAIEVRRTNGGMPEAAQVPPAEVIGVDDDKIGCRFVRRPNCGRHQTGQGQRQQSATGHRSSGQETETRR